MTTLRVIADDMVSGRGALARYAEELTRAIIRTAPRGTGVGVILAASPEPEYARVRELLPGLRALHPSALARRELAAAWQHGFTPLPGSGMVHATSLFAPLRRHDRTASIDEQTVVTVHDVLAWTHPELLPSRTVSWTKAMGRRAERHADAVVAPTHATAAALEEHLSLSGRVRVIGAAPASGLAVPEDAAARRAARGLPDRYVAAVVEDDARNGFAGLASVASAVGVPVVLLGSAGESGGIDGVDALTVVEDADPADRAAILSGAAVYVQPSIADGPAGALLDALALGLPIVARELPAIAELTADAGVLVAGDADDATLAEAVRGLLDDATAAQRAGIAAGDRAKAFTWRDAGEKVWQLHADL